MKEIYERPYFEVIELEGDIATAKTIKDSNETDILNMYLDEYNIYNIKY